MINPINGKEVSTASFVDQQKGKSPIKGVRETQTRVIMRSGLHCESRSRGMTNPIMGREVSTASFVGQHKGLSPIKGLDDTQSRITGLPRSDLRVPIKGNDYPIKRKGSDDSVICW